MTDAVRNRLSTSLAATHTIERELGGGGMARVFVATERALGRQVVIKTLPDDSWTATGAQRFRREILTAAQLQHANIVPLLAAGDAEGMPFFTMPLIDGATLRERMARGAVPTGEAIVILRDVARALGAAHARNVVHRDIKPENILLSAGAALVSDFGVAKAVSVATQGPEVSPTMTAVGVSVGTPAYMSPEQIAADPSVDHRSDLYAWGVVAYELLTGQRPFADLSGAALLKAQMGTMPPSLASVAPQVPHALADVVMRCLAKDPAHRPQSAAELLKVLDLPSGEINAPRARPGANRLVLAALAVVVALAGGWYFFGRNASTADESMIAVAPFRVGGAAPETRYLREGLGDIIVPQLQTLPEITAAGMRVMLDRWQRVGGDTDVDLDDDDAARAAQLTGAGRLILGDVVGTRERLTVNARLIRTRDRRELARARVDGSADSVFSLTTRLVTTLLSISDGASQERLRNVLSANPEAIAQYLIGEQNYRRGRYADAAQPFSAAYNADTTFAIAALRVHFTNGWTLDSQIPGPWIERAWTHRARLSGADSLLLIAEAGETYPAPMDLDGRIELMSALAERSNSAEIWYAYADYLFHNGQNAGDQDSWTKALAGFQRAESIDSSFAPALEHQTHILLTLGDVEGAKRAHARQARRDSTGDYFLVNDYVMQTVFGDARDYTRAANRVTEGRGPDAAGYLANFSSIFFAGNRPHLDAVDTVLAILERKSSGTLSSLSDRMRREVYWNTGRPALARERPAPAEDVYGHVETVIAALVWDVDTTQVANSASVLESALRAAPPTSRGVAFAAANFALAEHALARGDTAEVERRQLAIRSGIAAAARPWDVNTHRVYDAIIAAQLATARRGADAHARVETLDSLLSTVAGIDRRIVRAPGNLVLTELWERNNEPERALRVTRRRDGQTAFGMFNPERVRQVARLARSLGRSDEERAALQELVDMRERAEPHLQAEVASARARLAELNAKTSQ